MVQLLSKFYEEFDIDKPLLEYPRPQLVRDSYINLNGYYKYEITNTVDKPLSFSKDILVPFPIESHLSGVEAKLMPDQYLWYEKTFSLLEDISNKRCILHFGAVDQKARVYINQREIGSHIGGYLPFSFDITRYIKEGKNTLLVQVRDVTDTSHYSRGKQKLKPSGMFYTPCSGIWQSVWIEFVEETYIEKLKITPFLEEGMVRIELSIVEGEDYKQKSNKVGYTNKNTEKNKKLDTSLLEFDEIEKDEIYVKVLSADRRVLLEKYFLDKSIELVLQEVYPWSPETPYLYYLEVGYKKDKVTSYFAMRKYSIEEDEKGVPRLYLNNKPYFHNGLLDQGYWPESLYTAPTDSALIYDIQVAKDMGFNMLRKHAKIEPYRWYYHCDRIGMLVWQDMVNGGSEYDSKFVTIFPNIFPRLAETIVDNQYHKLSRNEEEGKLQFIQEVKDTVNKLYHFPSIAMWVPFNEGWGQFDSLQIVDIIKEIDKTRNIDHASGWFDQKGGEVKSHHVYFTKLRFKKDARPVVLSEFGGYIHGVKGHSYSNKVFGYRIYIKKDKFTRAIKRLYLKHIIREKTKHLCACVYTQLTDIESEMNGLLTYDRKVVKIDMDTIKEINQAVMK